MDNERIKRRIKALLNLAEDDKASDAEIETAMNMAARLMDEHHLERAEIEAHETEHRAAENFERVQARGTSLRPLQWESALSQAVERLVGSIKVYHSGQREFESGGLWKAKVRRDSMTFYGPAEDARLGAAMYEEWAGAIAAIAVGRYGGVCRGDGASYATGFAHALFDKALAADRARATTALPQTTTALAHYGGTTLASMLAHKREQAEKWLEDSCGVKLHSRRRSSARVSHNSYHAGRSDGAAAEFTAARSKKLV